MSKTEEALPPLGHLCSISKPLADFPKPVAYINMKTGQVKSLETLKREKPPGQWWPFNLQEEFCAALAQRQQVPEGWQLVPKATNREMREACRLSRAGNVSSDDLWAAMLAAAPALTAAPPAQQSDRCDWCCGTGRFADHACRFCGGKAKGSVFTSQQQQSAQPEQQEPQAREPARTICG